MESWIFFAIIAGLASNAGSFLYRLQLKDGASSGLALAWLMELSRVAIFGVAMFYNFRFEVSLSSVAVFVALSICEIVGVYLTMKMHTLSHLSISTIISRTRLVWIPIIAFLLFGEALKIWEYAGILVLFFGLSIVVSPAKLQFDRGIQVAYLCALVTAFISVLMKMASFYANPAAIIAFMSLPALIVLPLFMKQPTRKIRTLVKSNPKLIPLSMVINALAVFLAAYAISLGPVGKVAAVYQGMMIFSVLAGIFLLGERERIGKKLLGSFVTLVGVILLTAF